jgi:hypothetical protein
VQKIVTDYFVETILAALANGAPPAGPLSGCKLGLFLGNPTLNNNTVVADLTAGGILPTYTGYATKTITFSGTPLRDSSGNIVIRGTIAAPFQPTDGVTPNTVTGAYVEDTGGTHLFWAEKFDTPKAMLDALSFIAATLYFGAGAPWGMDSFNP